MVLSSARWMSLPARALENGIEYYNMDVAVLGLTQLVAECPADDAAF